MTRLFEPRVQCYRCDRPIGNKEAKLKSEEFGYETTHFVTKGVWIDNGVGGRQIMHVKCARKTEKEALR